MLKILRNKKKTKIILIGLAAIIILSFVFFGFDDVLGNKGKKGYIGKLSGQKVSLIEYKDSLDAVKNLAIMQYGDNLEEMSKSLNLEAQAWQRLALLKEAKKNRIKASDHRQYANRLNMETNFPDALTKTGGGAKDEGYD